MFLPACVWGLFLLVLKRQNKTKRNKIRSGGCDYELGDIGGHKKNQATSVSSGPCPRGGVICEDFAIFYDGRLREEKKKEKPQLNIFCQPHKTPCGSKKNMVSANDTREPGGNFVKILRFDNERCSAPTPAPATLIDYPILFLEALGAASRALSLPKNKHQKQKRHPRI